MFKSLMSDLFTSIVVRLSVFLLGFCFSSIYWSNKWNYYEPQARTQEAVLKERLELTENRGQRELAKVKHDYDQKINDLNARYTDAVNRLNSLHDNAAAGDESNMPALTGTSEGAEGSGAAEFSAKRGGVYSQDRIVKKLAEELLSLAADRDRLALKYNALLEIYEEHKAAFDSHAARSKVREL